MNKMGAMNAEELAKYKGVFVFAQQVDNVLSGISFELIGEGKRLAKQLDTQVTAVLIGSEVSGLVDELAAYYCNKVIPIMNELRANVDELEGYVPASKWPVPSYGELLYSVR